RPTVRAWHHSRRAAQFPGQEPNREAASPRSELIRFRASWVVPISQPPLRDGWVDVAAGRIVACGTRRTASESVESIVDLGDVAIVPGLVNAHTHLEPSYRGNRAPDTTSLANCVC